MGTVAETPANSPTGRQASKHVGVGAVANAVQQVVSALSAILGLAIAIRHIPHTELNVINLIWLFTNYVALLDLGLGRSLNQSIASAIGKGQQSEIPKLFWTAFCVVIPIGILAGAVLSLSAGQVIIGLHRPFPADAQGVLMLTGAIVPFAMLGIMMVGVLQADSKFVTGAAVQIPVLVITYLGPGVVYLLGAKSLYVFATVHLAARAISAIVLFLIANRHYGLFKHFGFDRSKLSELLKFGGWVAVSSLIGPVLAQFDRLIVLRIQGDTAMNVYSALVDAGSRALVVPISLAVGIFPVASRLIASKHHDELRKVSGDSLRLILVILFPLVFVAATMSRELIGLWLGQKYFDHGLIFALVLVGCLSNAVLWWLPYTLFQAGGKPKIPALILAGELVVYFPIFAWAVNQFGLTGAAIVWTGRAILEGLVITTIASRKGLFSLFTIEKEIPRRAKLALIAMLIVGVVLLLAPMTSAVRLMLVLVSSCLGVPQLVAALSEEQRQKVKNVARGLTNG